MEDDIEKRSLTWRRLFGLCLLSIWCCWSVGLAQLEITDPERGAYVSGEYEVLLKAENPSAIVMVQLFLDGGVVFSQEGWVERIVVDFGETIDRHELYASVRYQDGATVRSSVVTTRALRVDYEETARLLLLGVVVKTRSNRPIIDLSRDDFLVFENGQPLSIRSFYKEDLPLDLVFLLDTSSSLREDGIDALKHAAITFIQKLSSSDRVALYEFKKAPRKLTGFTTDRKRLIQEIESLEALGETALFNAAHLGLEDLLGRRKGRKAMVLFTDGRDSFYEDPHDKARMMREAITKAQNQEVTLFNLGLGKVNGPVLERMAEETGGRYYHADNPRRLPEIFNDILTDLKSQYILGVEPNPRGAGFQKIDVKVKKRRAVVYARKGYTRD